MSAPDRRRLVDRKPGALSIRRQCALLGSARSGVYRPALGGHAPMRRLAELFTAWPFLGSRRRTAMLRAEGHAVNRKRIRRLMRKMGIAALARSRAPASPAPGHKIFQYLPRGLAIERPNQVWCSDIRGGHGLGEPDGAAWRLTNTMDSSFCISALQEALARFGRPEIFNTDQGIEISMFHPDVMSDVNHRLECRNTIAGLAGSGIECPSINQAIVHRCLDFLVNANCLPAPTRA